MKKETRIANLLKDFHGDCKLIAEQCREEGYPDHGSNYELRTGKLWREVYLPEIEAIEEEPEE